jgi:hypothetical protein
MDNEIDLKRFDDINNIKCFLLSNIKITDSLLEMIKKTISNNINFENERYEYYKMGQLAVLNLINEIINFKEVLDE